MNTVLYSTVQNRESTRRNISLSGNIFKDQSDIKECNAQQMTDHLGANCYSFLFCGAINVLADNTIFVADNFFFANLLRCKDYELCINRNIRMSLPYQSGVGVQCTLYSVQCTIYSLQNTVYSVQCTVYSVQFTVYSVQCKLYRVHCTVNSLRCTVYSVRYIVYSVQCTL